ncbi:protein KAKU4 isoform X2 [Momordica charantia]|uniref:Protein KAKU4 isoform X2 n=1 Tax=Momordica charantia TaxID=3673 RepID=A0A6J1CFJ1_MOMCH|nr:protein KAKU4 isoform X2 [Momordica charantia]
MAAVPSYRDITGSRSGGKIVRARRARSRKNPYERPGLSNLGAGGNPSWISRFIFSPTLTIASGAGKLLSSVFVSDSDSSSSDGDSEDDVEVDDHDENHFFQGAEGVKKNGTSETVDLFRKDFPPQKKDSKHLIEQLLMQETFSRAERDKLFQIIESRVVEFQTIDAEAAGRLTEISNRAVDSDNDRPAVCSTAILEAKKWLNEKRLGLGSSSTSDMDHGPCTLNSTMLTVANDEEMGSPVDVAKSYMRARPPWASPSSNNFEFKSPSPLGLQLFKEETSYSITGNPLSSSKMKRESPASGSWNIQEEIRRVRSRATEEMLRTLPSAKLDWSSLTSDYKSNLSSVHSDNPKIHSEDKMQHAAKLIDKPLYWSADNTATHNLSESKITQDVSENGACLLDTTTIIVQQDKDLQTNPTTERKVSNSSLDERDCSTVHEVAGLANGFSPVPSSSGELVVDNKIVEENNSSGHDHEAKGPPVEERCELLSEASMEVPNVVEYTDKVPSEGNDIGKILPEENGATASKEKTDGGKVNNVEKPSLQSSASVGKSGATAYLRRGKRRN